MANEMIEIGKISSRGQVAIPSDIRNQLGLNEGAKVLFFLEDDTLMIKKMSMKTFAQITKPLKEAAKKVGMKESDASGIVHKFRIKV